MPATKKVKGRKPSLDNALATILEAIENDPAAAAKIAGALGAASGQARTIPEQARTVEMQHEDIDIPTPKEIVPTPAVVFKSPFPGFHQCVKHSQTIHHNNGEKTIVPEQWVRFDNGTARVTNPEHIDEMRKVAARNKAEGRATPWVEVRDEIAEILKDAGTDVKSIKSKDVTADTPAAALI